jgi:ribonuclease D
MLRRIHAFEFSSLFDTKVAATALGMAQVGLAAMLERFFGVALDKRQQRSDWGRRPLSDEQIEYAVEDTRHLLAMAAELRQRLQEAGEPAVLEVAAECRRLCTLYPEPKRFDPDEFVRIRGAECLDGQGKQALRELFAMRHELADRRDVPAFKILSNEMLLAVARARPRDQQALDQVRSISPKLARRYGSAILDAVHRAEHLGPLPRLPRRRSETQDLSDDERDVYERLRAWRKRTATARPTDSSLVVGRSCMLALARLRRKPRTLEGLLATGLLEPWRIERYGKEILAILDGARD